MEVFRAIGVEKEVLRQSAPQGTVSHTAWYTSIRLEPILLGRARELNPDGLRHSTEVLAVTEEAEKVLVTVRNADGTREDWEAKYVLGADGGRFMADQLGIAWEGEKDIFDMVSAHFHAPLSSVHPNSNAFISWFINPSLGGSIKSGYLYPLGPFPSNPETEECVSHRYVGSIVTEHFRSGGGKVFLLGDAAHQIPPWGALGMNTGLQDAFNLIWKLAFILRGNVKDPKRLLDTDEEERRPIAKSVAYSSPWRSHGDAMDKAIGASPAQTSEVNQAAMDAYFDKSHPDYAKKQIDVGKAQTVLDGEFCALGTEIGWFYPSVDANNEGETTRHDGQIREVGSFDNIFYHPSTIPGHHLPHFWLQRDGNTVSSRDLLDPRKLLLLGSSADVEARLGQGHPLIKVELIDCPEGWQDTDALWGKLCPIGTDGVVIVRPHGIVVWRSQLNDAAQADFLGQFV
ncbi:hypothetical protein N7532_009318 [Penicillium argentinense]|uniref:FAD-binding domain-containing protein n=1 Tax=Penicillium argentinense TaxID=1131581 RepID=A0A9W9EZ22_9EURO|nr:uncharacterized protein N7532_009318 [Penicillium argentinense]KAJ5090634.1 hypothetical protein N7532_009318 [Penicillium argentinense]